MGRVPSKLTDFTARAVATGHPRGLDVDETIREVIKLNLVDTLFCSCEKSGYYEKWTVRAKECLAKRKK